MPRKFRLLPNPLPAHPEAPEHLFYRPQLPEPNAFHALMLLASSTKRGASLRDIQYLRQRRS